MHDNICIQILDNYMVYNEFWYHSDNPISDAFRRAADVLDKIDYRIFQIKKIEVDDENGMWVFIRGEVSPEGFAIANEKARELARITRWF